MKILSLPLIFISLLAACSPSLTPKQAIIGDWAEDGGNYKLTVIDGGSATINGQAVKWSMPTDKLFEVVASTGNGPVALTATLKFNVEFMGKDALELRFLNPSTGEPGRVQIMKRVKD